MSSSQKVPGMCSIYQWFWYRPNQPRFYFWASGGSPGGGNGYPLQYSCLENSMKEQPRGLQSMGLQRVGHDWVTNTYWALKRKFWHRWPTWMNFENTALSEISLSQKDKNCMISLLRRETLAKRPFWETRRFKNYCSKRIKNTSCIIITKLPFLL